MAQRSNVNDLRIRVHADTRALTAALNSGALTLPPIAGVVNPAVNASGQASDTLAQSLAGQLNPDALAQAMKVPADLLRGVFDSARANLNAAASANFGAGAANTIVGGIHAGQYTTPGYRRWEAAPKCPVCEEDLNGGDLYTLYMEPSSTAVAWKGCKSCYQVFVSQIPGIETLRQLLAQALFYLDQANPLTQAIRMELANQSDDTPRSHALERWYTFAGNRALVIGFVTRYAGLISALREIAESLEAFLPDARLQVGLDEYEHLVATVDAFAPDVPACLERWRATHWGDDQVTRWGHLLAIRPARADRTGKEAVECL